MNKVKRDLLPVFLREKRLSAGLSQGKVAKKLGYTSPQFISNWERGLSSPPISTLKRLAGIYQVPIEEMFNVTLESTIKRVTEELQTKFEGRKK